MSLVFASASPSAAQEHTGQGRTPLPSPSFTLKQCYSDWSRRWLCPGDRAPEAGHLVPPQTLIDGAKYKRQVKLVPGLEARLDSCLLREQVTQDESDDYADDAFIAVVENRELQKQLDAAPTWSGAIKWGAAAATLTAAVGFILGVIFS